MGLSYPFYILIQLIFVFFSAIKHLKVIIEANDKDTSKRSCRRLVRTYPGNIFPVVHPFLFFLSSFSVFGQGGDQTRVKLELVGVGS